VGNPGGEIGEGGELDAATCRIRRTVAWGCAAR